VIYLPAATAPLGTLRLTARRRSLLRLFAWFEEAAQQLHTVLTEVANNKRSAQWRALADAALLSWDQSSPATPAYASVDANAKLDMGTEPIFTL
jgi:hypothetical protein